MLTALFVQRDLEVIGKLSDGMDPDGYELTAFRFILHPVYKNLPKSKKLKELYMDHMMPRYERDGALMHMWFALDAIGTTHVEDINGLFESTVTLKIDDGEVLYRKLLTTVAVDLASEVDRSIAFIQEVVSSKRLRNCSYAKNYMPPEEKRPIAFSFLPHILSLLQEADKQGILAPDDLNPLLMWLEGCDEGKLRRPVLKFEPLQGFKHTCKLGCSYSCY